MNALAEYLARFDYTAIRLVRADTGHLRLERALINGREVTLYLDTGAGGTVLDVACACHLGLALAADGGGAGGAGSATMERFRVHLAALDLDGLVEENFPGNAIDLSHVNRALRARGERPMDGVLGADVLDAREAIIDYKHLALFLKRNARRREMAA